MCSIVSGLWGNSGEQNGEIAENKTTLSIQKLILETDIDMS